jgi:hypothetical protein
MKTIILSGVLVLLSGLASLMAQNEQLTVPLTNPGKTYTLKVNLINGSITVSSYSGSEIQIDATVSAIPNDEETKQEENGMKRIAGAKGYEITAEENNNVVDVHTNSFANNVSLNLKIPGQDVKLVLSTINDGDIVVENVKGELEVNNVNGAIKVVNHSGSVVATSINEAIIVNFTAVKAGAAMAFSSLTGNIDLTFPSDLKANLKLKSDMGDIFSDFDVAVEKSNSRVNRTAQSGMYKLELEDWVYGKINGGGPEFMMKNMNGNIYIRKAK